MKFVTHLDVKMQKNSKIYIAGHRGLVGSAIVKNFKGKGYTNLVHRTRKELDLLDHKPSKEKVAIKNLSESFGVSGRLDSEYYQPKYDEILEKIKLTEYDKLGNIVNMLKSIEPGSEAYQESGIPFVRVSNLTKFEISKPDIHLSKNLFDDEVLEKLQPKKDTILLSKDGTVGIAYNVKKDSYFVTSGAILHLSIKKDDVLPEYLTLVLNSLLVQMQSQRDAGGSIIKHWKPSEIKKILIPIIDKTIQIQIEQKIKKSFELKEQSKEFLDKDVEIFKEKISQIAKNVLLNSSLDKNFAKIVVGKDNEIIEEVIKIEKNQKTNLILNEKEFSIIKTKTLPKPLKKGEIVE